MPTINSQAEKNADGETDFRSSNLLVVLHMRARFGGKREFKKYLYGRSDEGARLLFKFRSGKHGLNEELGRHSDRDGRVECTLCGAECESV